MVTEHLGAAPAGLLRYPLASLEDDNTAIGNALDLALFGI